jgi:hypothetical protein
MGSWTPSRTRDDGVIVMGYFTPGQEADAFLRDLGRVGLVRPFDWMAWLKTPRGEELREPAAVATAAPEELANLLTAIVRSERFSEGLPGGRPRVRSVARDRAPGQRAAVGRDGRLTFVTKPWPLARAPGR